MLQYATWTPAALQERHEQLMEDLLAHYTATILEVV